MSLSTVITGTAHLRGTIREPYLLIDFAFSQVHACRPKLTLGDWARALPGSRWDAEERAWHVWSLGPNPDQVLAEAGIRLEGDIQGITSLNALYAPVTRLADNGRTVMVRTRFMGTDGVQKLVGGSGVYDASTKLLHVPASDTVVNVGGILMERPGIAWDAASLEAGYLAHSRSPLLSESLGAHLGTMANAVTPHEVAPAIRAIQEVTSGPVGSFGVDLLPYQMVGAYAVAGGHGLLADAPGVGKTFQFLAACAVLRADRILVVVPPIVLTNWEREIARSGLAAPGSVAKFVSGRKEPVLEGKKFVVISDMMLANRHATRQAIVDWLREGKSAVAGVDEAHRMKSLESARSQTLLNVKAEVPNLRGVAITGTPVLAGPHELVPMLEFTGHLAPVFGGAGPFLEKYCTQDRWGGFHPRKRALPELNALLNEHVWVRRTKDQVQPQLPARQFVESITDVSLTEYRRELKSVTNHIEAWVKSTRARLGRRPNEAEVDAFISDSLPFISRLRSAAGVAKVPAAAERVKEWLADDPSRPLTLWTHHREVTDAMVQAVKDAGFAVGEISGSATDVERVAAVDAFQAGKIPVLVCSITAAGVGITLTRGSDAIFVEVDWTPALMIQAIDRHHRVGQVRPVTGTLLLAPGTLDDHVMARVGSKGETVSAILGDDTNKISVSGERELVSSKEILRGLVAKALK